MSPPPASHRPDTTPRRKKRPRPLPHVNARNLAIEKKRREQMNDNFVDLAHLVPSLAHTQRLTKVHIVRETIAHLRNHQALCAATAHEILGLRADLERLRRPGAAALAASPTVARLLAVSRLRSGDGTATLRDAHEGPEPKGGSTALDGSGDGDGARQQVSVLWEAGHGNEVSAQDAQSLWDTGYDFTGIFESGQEPLLWPLAPDASASSSNLLGANGVPTPPRHSFDLDVMTNLVYPTTFLPEDMIYNASLKDSHLGDAWSGLGLG
ncbi:Basic helix-loop-helix dimerization region bHLH [Cordyceps militaris CM01]|uniref:Basic helix-loop-helix dimerization region bHLH n=1 Tax=Cordyceps militaris (strain CM01) TaxID=983644 RepID=G3JSL4_CORMM|nr:Basic helix-loop-helix dimerization region bHLH [Cordyceps militaris CM01]EGX88860.1 Basic helix-loop-helix dimerization region bHLH [Cordyceps militaris CM01]